MSDNGAIPPSKREIGQQRRAEAHRLRREERLDNTEIAARLGVSTRQVRFYFNPESRARDNAQGREDWHDPVKRARAAARILAYRRSPAGRRSQRYTNLRRRPKKRAWDHAHRAPCPECGEPMGVATQNPSKRPDRCRRCVRQAVHDRTAKWLAMRKDEGLANWEIADREGVKVEDVSDLLQRSKVARFPDLEWAHAPYKRRGPGGGVNAQQEAVLREIQDLAIEIADECEAGEWVPWGTLRRYRSAKQRLEDFEEQANSHLAGRREK